MQSGCPCECHSFGVTAVPPWVTFKFQHAPTLPLMRGDEQCTQDPAYFGLFLLKVTLEQGGSAPPLPFGASVAHPSQRDRAHHNCRRGQEKI